MKDEKKPSMKKTKTMKLGLSIVEENIYNQMDFNLFLSGLSFEFIEKDITLLQHFSFISQFCKNIIAYDFAPNQKAKLVNIVKSCHLFNPTVCAIGCGFCDAPMMKQADVSIELVLRK